MGENKEEKTTLINRNSYVSLSLVITLIGGVVWITAIYANAKMNTKALGKLNKKVIDLEKTYNDDVKIVKNDLGVIKGQLETILIYTKADND